MYVAKLSVNLGPIKRIEEQYDCQETEKFIREFNTAGSFYVLTKKQTRSLLRSSSLDSIRNRIFTQAQEKNISPSAWEIRSPLSETKEKRTC